MGQRKPCDIAREALFELAKRAGKNRVVAVQGDGLAWQPVMASLTHAGGGFAPAPTALQAP